MEQLCDGSVANDITYYVIRMSGLLRFVLRLFRHPKCRRRFSLESQNICKFSEATMNMRLCTNFS